MPDYVESTAYQTEDVPLQHIIYPEGSPETTDREDLDRLLHDDVSETLSEELPPIDGGRGAWNCLIGCCLLEAMIWSFALSFGVFQRYYGDHEAFMYSNQIPTIGTSAVGVSFLGMPFVVPFALNWPQFRWLMCLLGCLLCPIGLAAASTATDAWQLVAYQGVMYGTGWVICYTAFHFILNEWWEKRRALAHDILFASSAASGLLIPVLLNWMLDNFGFRVTLRMYMAVTIIVSIPGLLLIHPRSFSSRHGLDAPDSKPRRVIAMLPLAWNIHFLLFTVAVFAQGLGYFIPNILLPLYSDELGYPPAAGSALLSVLLVSQALGRIWHGWFSDHANIHVTLSISTLISAGASWFLWGSGKTMISLLLFALLWGFFSSSYSVLFMRMSNFLRGADKEVLYPSDHLDVVLYAFFSFVRGISTILDGPYCAHLIQEQDTLVDIRFFGLLRYKTVLQFAVGSMLASSIVGVGWLCSKMCLPRASRTTSRID